MLLRIVTDCKVVHKQDTVEVGFLTLCRGTTAGRISMVLLLRCLSDRPVCIEQWPMTNEKLYCGSVQALLHTKQGKMKQRKVSRFMPSFGMVRPDKLWVGIHQEGKDEWSQVLRSSSFFGVCGL